MIEIMIVDDQPLVVEGLKMILNSFDDINVIATAGNGQDACDNMNLYNLLFLGKPPAFFI